MSNTDKKVNTETVECLREQLAKNTSEVVELRLRLNAVTQQRDALAGQMLTLQIDLSLLQQQLKSKEIV